MARWRVTYSDGTFVDLHSDSEPEAKRHAEEGDRIVMTSSGLVARALAINKIVVKVEMTKP